MGQEISGLDPSASEIPKCFIVVVAPMVTAIIYLLTHFYYSHGPSLVMIV